MRRRWQGGGGQAAPGVGHGQAVGWRGPPPAELQGTPTGWWLGGEWLPFYWRRGGAPPLPPARSTQASPQCALLPSAPSSPTPPLQTTAWMPWMQRRCPPAVRSTHARCWLPWGTTGRRSHRRRGQRSRCVCSAHQHTQQRSGVRPARLVAHPPSWLHACGLSTSVCEADARTCTRRSAHTHTHAGLHACALTQTHSHTHTHTHTYARTHAPAYTHTLHHCTWMRCTHSAQLRRAHFPCRCAPPTALTQTASRRGCRPTGPPPTRQRPTPAPTACLRPARTQLGRRARAKGCPTA